MPLSESPYFPDEQPKTVYLNPKTEIPTSNNARSWVGFNIGEIVVDYIRKECERWWRELNEW